MKILTSNTGRVWSETLSAETSTTEERENDDAHAEIHRSLSDCFRANNLVILSGLGTSLYVNVSQSSDGGRTATPGKRLAPTMGDLWLKASEATAETFSNVKEWVKFPEEKRGNIEALLSYCKLALEFLDDQQKTRTIQSFVNTAEKIIRDEVNFLDANDEVHWHSELVKRIARRSNRKTRAKIFTTNYDLCFEQAAKLGRFIVVDGFSHTAPQSFDSIYFNYDTVQLGLEPERLELVNNVFHLYKLHGSIDWERDPSSSEIRRVPGTTSPVLIYPRNTKYELAFEQPYIEMMAAFQSAIRQPNTGLLIIGFGFNDNHIAEPILSAVKSNLSLKVVVCDPLIESASASNSYSSKLRFLAEQGDARIALIAGTFQEIVPAIPDIAALNDLEQHNERMRLLRAKP